MLCRIVSPPCCQGTVHARVPDSPTSIVLGFGRRVSKLSETDSPWCGEGLGSIPSGGDGIALVDEKVKTRIFEPGGKSELADGDAVGEKKSETE